MGENAHNGKERQIDKYKKTTCQKVLEKEEAPFVNK